VTAGETLGRPTRTSDVGPPSLTVILVILVLALPLGSAPRGAPVKELAVTVDDLPQGGPEFGFERMQQMTDALTAAIRAHHVPVTGFVNEAQLFTKAGEVDRRIALLDEWLSADVELGNHTFSHSSFLDTSLREFEEQVIRGETVTRLLAAQHRVPYRYFRHPYVETGKDADARAALETFLSERGYRIAPVTLSNDDWAYALLYGDAKSRSDRDAMLKISEAYLAHTEATLVRSEAFSTRLFHRQIRQVLLLHANELNAEHFGDVLRHFERHGYTWVALERALDDPAYGEPNTWARPGGVDWYQRWAQTRAVDLGDVPNADLPSSVWQAYRELDAKSPARIPGRRN
jgi:peptidoglycan-N-acetylglucosamine deacetylase